jgi:hypothetical protein
MAPQPRNREGGPAQIRCQNRGGDPGAAPQEEERRPLPDGARVACTYGAGAARPLPAAPAEGLAQPPRRAGAAHSLESPA